MTEFERQYLGEFVRDEKFERAVDAWSRYYDVVERYDAHHCKGRSKSGQAVPSTFAEEAICSSHALMTYREMLLGLEKEYERRDWLEAKKVAQRSR